MLEHLAQKLYRSQYQDLLKKVIKQLDLSNVAANKLKIIADAFSFMSRFVIVFICVNITVRNKY